MAQLLAAASLTLDVVGCQALAVASLHRNSLVTGTPVLATRNAVQRILGGDHWRRSYTRISATADGNAEGEVEENLPKAATLKQLDQQLATLSERDEFPVSRPSLGPSSQQIRPLKRQPGEQGTDGEAEWPEFSPGFLGFMAFALLLLTVVNNLLYRTFLGPPVVPFRSGDPALTSAGAEPRYRIRSLSQERDEKAKAAAEEITPYSPAIESSVGPMLTSE